MNRVKHRCLFVLMPITLVLSCLAVFDAYADPAGDSALAGVDRALNKARTQYLEYDVTTREAGNTRTLAESVWIKGNMRRVEFTAPPDMKGTKLLILSPTQMYVYLPAFGKVRRVASHTRDTGFMGMAFTPADLGSSFGGEYGADIMSATPASYELVLTPKVSLADYGKIEMSVDRTRMVPVELRYYNESGTKVKTETRTGYSCQDEVCDPQERKMVDHTRADTWTRLVRKVWKVNHEFKEELFMRKSLSQ
jgi:outer membrane lipoprotein-sorting protein